MEAKPKVFDCVRMKREGALRVRREIEGMTRAEQLAYWARGTRELLAEQEALRAAAATRRTDATTSDPEA